MADFQKTSPWNSWKLILLLAAVYGAANLFAFRLVWMLSEGSEWEEWRQIVWRNFVVGFIASQVAAISMALVFTPGRFVRRLAYWWAVGGALWVCWLIGYGVLRVSFTNGHGWRFTGEDVWDVPLSLPLAALIVQAPLWALRLCFGWRWEREGDAPATAVVRWSLADLLMGTALVGLSLGLARLVDPRDNGLWMSWVVFTVYTFVFTLFGVAPAMRLTLRRWRWWFGALLFLVYATLGGCLFLAINDGLDSSRAERFWSDPEFHISVTIPPFLAFGAGLLLATGVARMCGFRLVMGRPHKPVGSATDNGS